ncbi:F0F1 ATP synthase subunit B [Bartonella ancashensis]|uniref:ATP synthase subunit b n=1 Tax=Bartonella ancashensis TaxID=1318743 RepID=A0A0M4LHF3_9HYPH|nr:F0F1 ATP synthase subunit B [Bartonella ancashensis]ALE04082.1 ATP synthase B chain [Bartonella ancashensis]
MTDTFWALVGLILFVMLLIYFRVPTMVIRSLDDRAKRIKEELDEALRLREEAQELLAEYQRRCAEAEKDAQGILAAAKREAEFVVSEARIKTDEYIKNCTKLVEQKISQAENDAIREISSSAVDLAISAAQMLISHESSSKKEDGFFGEAVATIKKNLH